MFRGLRSFNASTCLFEALCPAFATKADKETVGFLAQECCWHTLPHDRINNEFNAPSCNLQIGRRRASARKRNSQRQAVMRKKQTITRSNKWHISMTVAAQVLVDRPSELFTSTSKHVQLSQKRVSMLPAINIGQHAELACVKHNAPWLRDGYMRFCVSARHVNQGTNA